MNIQERFQELSKIVSSGTLINEERQGGEVSFYIFDYTPEEEMLVREFVYHLVARHSWSGSEIKPVECDLYRLMI